MLIFISSFHHLSPCTFPDVFNHVQHNVHQHILFFHEYTNEHAHTSLPGDKEKYTHDHIKIHRYPTAAECTVHMHQLFFCRSSPRTRWPKTDAWTEEVSSSRGASRSGSLHPCTAPNKEAHPRRRQHKRLTTLSGTLDSHNTRMTVRIWTCFKVCSHSMSTELTAEEGAV